MKRNKHAGTTNRRRSLRQPGHRGRSGSAGAAVYILPGFNLSAATHRSSRPAQPIGSFSVSLPNPLICREFANFPFVLNEIAPARPTSSLVAPRAQLSPASRNSGPLPAGFTSSPTRVPKPLICQEFKNFSFAPTEIRKPKTTHSTPLLDGSSPPCPPVLSPTSPCHPP